MAPVTGAAGGSETLATGWVASFHPGLHETFAGDAVAALARALEAKDRYTHGHSDRVSRYAAAIAAELGLAVRLAREIKLAGELHDVGKIGVPDEILKKPGRLTREEYRTILEHTVIGERILMPLFPEGHTVLAVTRWHHERFDGSGGPDGLAGEAIPLAARIVAVADAFDAMTSSRSYRPALPLAAALRELEEGAGSQFDPVCVAAFLAVLRRVRATTARRRVPARQRLGRGRWAVRGGLRLAAFAPRRAAARARWSPAGCPTRHLHRPGRDPPTGRTPRPSRARGARLDSALTWVRQLRVHRRAAVRAPPEPLARIGGRMPSLKPPHLLPALLGVAALAGLHGPIDQRPRPARDDRRPVAGARRRQGRHGHDLEHVRRLR